MAEGSNNLLAEFKTHLAADKKKSAALFVLLAVLLVFLVRAVGGGSSSATADAVSIPPSGVAGDMTPNAALIRPIPQFTASASSRSGVDQAVERISRALAAADPFRDRPMASVKGAPRMLDRDPFTTPAWRAFASEASPAAGGEESGRTTPSPGFFERFGRRIAETQRSRQELEERIEAELAELELQSTVTGPIRMAHISGRMVREGETIRGFSVVRIVDRGVTLRKSGINLTLNMP